MSSAANFGRELTEAHSYALAASSCFTCGSQTVNWLPRPKLALHGDFAAMCVRDRLCNAETETGVLAATPGACLVGPVKTVEDMR